MSDKPLPKGRINATVKFIFDGDTFQIQDSNTKDEYRIRLYGIDAPERGQEYGGIVQYLTQQRLQGKDVTVEFTQTSQKGREVAIVWVGSKCLNLQMLEEGLAWKTLQFNDRYSDRFIRAEIDAKVNQRGLWSIPNPEEPHKYRTRMENPHLNEAQKAAARTEHYKAAVARDRLEVENYKINLKNAKPNPKKYISVNPDDLVDNNYHYEDRKLPSFLKMVKEKFNDFKNAVSGLSSGKTKQDTIFDNMFSENDFSVNKLMRNKIEKNDNSSVSLNEIVRNKNKGNKPWLKERINVK